MLPQIAMPALLFLLFLNYIVPETTEESQQMCCITEVNGGMVVEEFMVPDYFIIPSVLAGDLPKAPLIW